jgi:inner membrane protein
MEDVLVNDFSMLYSSLQSRIRRSMGLKLITVCGLAVVMIIPALLVENLVENRTKRAASVVKEISGIVGGPQTFLGPTLAIPYSIPPQSPVDSAKHGMYLVFPAQASAALKIATGRNSIGTGQNSWSG